MTDVEVALADLGEIATREIAKKKKPNNLDEMIEIAEKLSLDYPFIRIDLYSADNKIYFGE